MMNIPIPISTSAKDWFSRVFSVLSRPQPVAKPSESKQIVDGQKAYEDFLACKMQDPEFRAIRERERWKTRLWMRLVEERIDRGVTPKEMAKRMKIKLKDVLLFEDGDYDYTSLGVLSRYASALNLKVSFTVEPMDDEERSRPA